MLKKILLLLLLPLTFSACTVDIDRINDEIFVRTGNLEQYGCWDTKNTLYVPSLYGDEFIVISNILDYNLLVDGSCNYNAIDFRRNDLIIGQYWVDSNTESINYTYLKNRYNEYTLYVDFLQNFGGRPKYVTYHAIVPKLYSSDRVFVQTKVIYP